MAKGKKGGFHVKGMTSHHSSKHGGKRKHGGRRKRHGGKK